ncbi:MAG: CRISPR-associated endonuclease Cas6 [Arcicella sp.]|nr:CRISPR-associated endonuclease Cas6 [Arcicella sp.]
MNLQIPQTTITFPEIRLQTRDAHKLRGFFGNLFREHSVLLHNHFQETDKFRQGYTLVQYKVLDHLPTLMGLGEGADLLVDLFMKMKHLEIDGQFYELMAKNIKHQQVEIGLSNTLYEYRFENLWMALNQNNYREFMKASADEQNKMFDRILKNNLLAFLNGMGCQLAIDEPIMCKFSLKKLVIPTSKTIK